MEKKARPPKKLRSACDACHQGKVRCSGGNPCEMCQGLEAECVYSVSNRIGRPKGTKNKKTLDRLGQAAHDGSRSSGASRGESPREATDAPFSAASTTDFGNELDDWDALSLRSSYDPLLSVFDSSGQWARPDSFAADLSNEVRTADSNVAALGGLGRCVVCGTEFDAEHGLWQAPLGNHDALSYSPPSISQRGSTAGVATSAPLAPGDAMSFIYSTPSMGSDASSYSSYHHVHAGGNATGPTAQRSASASLFSSPKRQAQETTSGANLRRASGQDLDGSQCDCLQYHAELLCRLKELQTDQSTGIDLLLVRAKESVSAWQALLQCRECQQGDDQEVLLLSAMSIRVFVRRLQGLSLDSGMDAPFDAPPDISRVSPASAVSPTQEFSADNSNGGGGIGKSCGGPGPDLGTGPLASSVAANIGMFAVTGGDRVAVARLLLSRILGQIKCVLAGLKQRLGLLKWQGRHTGKVASQKPATATDTASLAGDGCGLEHLLGLLESLEGTVERLIQQWREGTGV